MPFPEYVPDTTVDGTTYLFTSIQEMEREFSKLGIDLHVDDADSTDDNYVTGTDPETTVANVLTEIIQRATSKVHEHLAPKYTAEVLSTIPRIREIATYWACHDLSRRRGNEPLYEAEVAEGIEALEDYRHGVRYLDAPQSGQRAVVQSYQSDNRFYRNPIRVLRTSSTRIVPQNNLAWNYPFFWL